MLNLIKVKVHLQTHAAAHTPQLSRCRKPFLHLHTLLLCAPGHKPLVLCAQSLGGISSSFLALSYLKLQLSRAFAVQPSCCGLRHVRRSYLWAHFSAAARGIADSSGGK